MALVQAALPIVEDDATIRALLEAAEVPPLLAAVAWVSGDRSILREEFLPDPSAILDPNGGLSPQRQAEARDLAAAALSRYRDAGCPPPPPPDHDELRPLLEFVVGGSAMDDYLPLFEEELGIAGVDLRAPAWHKDELAPDTDFRVVVIGAGMSGLLAGYRLGQAGIPCGWRFASVNPGVSMRPSRMAPPRPATITSRLAAKNG